MVRRLLPANRSVLLLGARQTGKSTLLRSLAPDLELNFASPATFREYAAHPERLEAELLAAPKSVKLVMLDEVQRIPAVLDTVQVIVDAQPERFSFLLSGSSARKLRRGSVNLLPGRVRSLALHPLVASEIGSEFELKRVLLQGSLPGIYRQEDDEERSADLRSYVDTYLREEIQAEALVRDIGGYARMLELMAASSGRVLNLLNLSRDSGIRYETLRRYVSILEDTLLGFVVPAWSPGDKVGLVAHPKVFLFDTGVRNVLLRRNLKTIAPDDKGILFEHLVAFELCRRTGGICPEAKVSHFRTKHDAEVDFVFEIDNELWAIEVKSGSDPTSFRASGMKALSQRARIARKIVVFQGSKKLQRDDLEFIPFLDFAHSLPM